MKGHEYARTKVRDHLSTYVPGRLAAIRAALSVTTPSNPPAGAYLLADALPSDPALYPAVVVMSTGAPRIQRQSVVASNIPSDFIVLYSLRVVIACRTDTAGGEEQASRDRDRLLLAAREALLGRVNLPADVEFFTNDMVEETGAAAQDLRGRPLAAGQLRFDVAVLETLAPTTTVSNVVTTETDIAGKPSGTVSLT